MIVRRMIWLSVLLFALLVGCGRHSNTSAERHSTKSNIIRGKITSDNHGDPVVGATIWLVGTEYRTVSSFDGKYVVWGIPSGVYNLMFTLMGMQDTTQVGVEVSDSNVSRLDMKMQTDPLWLEGFTISVSQRSGIWTITETPEVNEKRDRNVVTTVDDLLWLPTMYSQLAPPRIEKLRYKQVDSTEAPQALGSLQGNVSWQPSGQPIPNLRVFLGPPDILVRTDSLGNFRFDSLPPNDYGLSFDCIFKTFRIYEPIEVSSETVTDVEVTFEDCINPESATFHTGYTHGVALATREVSSREYKLSLDTSILLFRGDDMSGTLNSCYLSCGDLIVKPCEEATYTAGHERGHDSSAIEQYNRLGININDTLNCLRYQTALSEYFDCGSLGPNMPVSSTSLSEAKGSVTSNASAISILDGGELPDTLSFADIFQLLPPNLAMIAQSSEVTYRRNQEAKDYLIFRSISQNQNDTTHFILDLLDGSVYPKTCFAQPD